MESIVLHNNGLDNLRLQARKLTADSLSLAALFAKEAILLNRRDEASRLKELHRSVRQQLERATSDENAASNGHSTVELITSLGRLVGGAAIKMVSNNKRLSAFANYLLTGSNSKEYPFGMVRVCIGPKGVPDDVGVVSVSRLTRESNREESEVIHDMQERGYLLFSDREFSILVDMLVEDIQEGRLHLPISTEKLIEITGPTH